METEKEKKEEVLTGTKEDVETLSFMLESEEKATESNKKEVEEQERTRISKKLFLENYEICRGVVSAICDKIGINNATFYKWKNSDPEFVENLEKLKENINDEVEDILMGLVRIKRDPTSVRYYLDRRHPDYRPRQELGGIEGQPLPPIQVEIVEPKHANTNTEKNTSDGSVQEEQSEHKEDKGE
jgi:hypothetical protein